MKKNFLTSIGQLTAEENLLLFFPVYEKLRNSQEPVVLYGSGPLTELLFARYDIKKLKIIGISDGDMTKWGSKLFNITIIPPKEINTFDKATVLIISGSSQPEIKEFLEKLLKPEILIIPGMEFYYFNAIEEISYRKNDLPLWQNQWNQWKTGLENKKKILCVLEGETLEPFFLHCMTAIKEQLTIFAQSPYISNGLKERGFNVINLRTLWKNVRQQYSISHDMIAIEGEMVKSVNQSLLSKQLTFPQTSQKVFDAIFYDRLIFQLLQNTGLEEFSKQTVTQETWEACWYIGPFQDAEPAALLVQCHQEKIPILLFYTGKEMNPFIEKSLKSLSTVLIEPQGFLKICEEKRWSEILNHLDQAPLQYPVYVHNITLIPFSLTRRWETRELVKKTLKNLALSDQTNELIIVKCREKVRHFNGQIGEADFCREYMAEILENNDRIIVLDHSFTNLEIVRKARKILAIEPCLITSIAQTMGKPYEISTQFKK